DLRAIAIVAFSPDVLAVHPSNPAKDLKQFIDNGKRTSFTYGSAGVGTGPHIGAEYFFREIAKVQAVHVPFTGGAPAVTAAIGNHVDAIVLTLPTVVPSITQGLLRGIGLASAARNSAVPNVRTYGEMGFPNVYSGSWVGFFAPAKTPDAVVAKLNAEINAIMQEPPAQEKLKTIGFDVMIKKEVEAADYFKSEVASWGKMTRAIGYSSDLSQRHDARPPKLAPTPTRPHKGRRAHRVRAVRYRLTITLRIAVLPPLLAVSALCSAPSNSTRFSTRWPWKPKWLPSRS